MKGVPNFANNNYIFFGDWIILMDNLKKNPAKDFRFRSEPFAWYAIYFFWLSERKF